MTLRTWKLTALPSRRVSRNRRREMAARLWNLAPAATKFASPGDAHPAERRKIQPHPFSSWLNRDSISAPRSFGVDSRWAKYSN